MLLEQFKIRRRKVVGWKKEDTDTLDRHWESVLFRSADARFGVLRSIYAQRFNQWPSAVPLFWQTEVHLVEVQWILCNIYRRLSLVCYYPFWVWVNFSTGDSWILSLNEQLRVWVCFASNIPSFCRKGGILHSHFLCVPLRVTVSRMVRVISL